jgi:hypothetical protein
VEHPRCNFNEERNHEYFPARKCATSNPTGGFDLSCDADTAFPLFSPEGERECAPGWNPIAVYPETIAFTA